MNLTIETIKKLIKEELEEVYKGKDRIIYAPMMKRPPGERYHWEESGSYILPAENPHDKLDPMVKEKIPAHSDEETLKQAYELSSMLGTEPEQSMEDFIQGIKLSANPDLARQEAIKELQEYIKSEQAKARSLPSGSAERKAYSKRISNMKIRLNYLQASENLEDLFDWDSL